MLVSAHRPSILYISYDGASEPLGRSQVVAYLRQLAGWADITLVSFEKPGGAGSPETAQLLDEAGIRWRPLSYHRRPAVLSTLWDIVAGVRAVRGEQRRRPAEIVHVRSYVPALIALLAASRIRRWRLLFDIRGFWVDERIDGGLWKRDGMLHRVGRLCERWFFREADAVVTLTNASVPQIRAWLSGRDVPVRVIPTCAPVDRFADSRFEGTPRAVWCGSIGERYRFELGVRLAQVLGLPFLVLTREVELARRLLAGTPAEVREVRPERIPSELREGDIGLCLHGDDFSLTASAPTRFAEYLSAGMIVAVTPGIGDLDDLVERNHVGYVVREDTPEALREAATTLVRLADDPAVRARARRIARERFDLESGVAEYRALYESLTACRPQGP